MFCRSLFVHLNFFFWPLCCLFFFDIRILITPLVFSNSSWVYRLWTFIFTFALFITVFELYRWQSSWSRDEIICDFSGADPGFQARGGGAHLKKLGRAEGGANIFGVFRVTNHDFTPKNHIFSNFRGGGGGGRRVPPLDPPMLLTLWLLPKSHDLVIIGWDPCVPATTCFWVLLKNIIYQN